MTPNEIGPHCVRIPNGIITFGADPIELSYLGKTYRFEWHRMLGPHFCKKNGDELKNPPGERNKWWKGFDLWMRQGQRTEGGKCVFDVGTPCGECFGKGSIPIDKRNARVCSSCNGEGSHYPVPTTPRKFDY